MKEVPTRMKIPGSDPPAYWTCPEGTPPADCWSSFVDTFNLKDVLNEIDAFYEDKTIYFLPDCSPHKTAGNTGGFDFGVLAKIPKLVN